MRVSIITGTGKYIPETIVKNEDFLVRTFYDENHNIIDKPTAEVIQKFEAITEIKERRYLEKELFNSDIAAIAGEQAIQKSGVDRNQLDYVIVAHNFGDIDMEQARVDLMPSISARVKNKLKINNRKCRPYDMTFGCPGWIEALILAHQLIQSNHAHKILVIGSETLSRAVDKYDRNAMIFADGAAAVVLEGKESEKAVGILSYDSVSDNGEELNYLYNGPSLNLEYTENNSTVTMLGRKIYEYALTYVPVAMKETIDLAGLSIQDIKMIFLHQANAKMDHAMVERLYKLYNVPEPDFVAPMTVQYLGNTSVATVPTMFDMVLNNEMDGYELFPGDNVVFASVGAGMNINAVVYKLP